MSLQQFREMRVEELHSELDRMRRHLFDLRAQAVTEKLEDPTMITKTKRDIARVLTVLTQRGEQDVENKQHHFEKVATQRGKRAKRPGQGA
jgi:large subunit ribosomal protein L29